MVWHGMHGRASQDTTPHPDVTIVLEVDITGQQSKMPLIAFPRLARRSNKKLIQTQSDFAKS